MERNISRRSLGRWITSLFVLKSLPSPAAEPSTSPDPSEPIPLEESSDPIAQVFLRALMESRRVPLYYFGGSTPGALRVLRPECLFRLRPGGRIYVRGHCELRRESRTLRLDRIRLA
jgi:predicted DNA-binding transcriptional regulator YafY